MGRLRTPWTSQPKFITGLSSEFARPTFAFNAATGLVDVVANAAITKSNVTTKPSLAGIGLQTTATGTNDGIYTLSSLAADTTPFSVLIVVKIGAVSGDVGLFQWAGSTGATGSPHALIKNTTGNLQIYGSAVGYVATQTGVLTAGSVHSIVLTFDGTTAYLCRNGQMTSAAGPWIGAGAVKTHAWFDNGFNTVDTGNAVYAGAIWSGKALSVAKALALSRNPWQVFQPLARNVFSDVAAAGGAANIALAGIPTAEFIGAPVIGVDITSTGIPTAESVGASVIGVAIAIVGIPTAESVGAPVISVNVALAGVPTAESVGAPIVQFVSPDPPADIYLESIPTAESVGAPGLVWENPFVFASTPGRQLHKKKDPEPVIPPIISPVVPPVLRPKPPVVEPKQIRPVVEPKQVEAPRPDRTVEIYATQMAHMAESIRNLHAAQVALQREIKDLREHHAKQTARQQEVEDMDIMFVASVLAKMNIR